MTKREGFVSVMQMLSETFNRQLSPGMLEGYWMALEQLDVEALAGAARKAIVDSKFMPVPAELLAFAGRAKPDVAAEAMLCWQEVRRAIDKHDYLVRSIDFGPRINAVISNLGGWDTLCKASLPELDSPGWLRKRFCEVYEAFAPLDPATLRGEALAGDLPPRFVCGKDIQVKIAGQPEFVALPPTAQEAADHIAELAEKLS